MSAPVPVDGSTRIDNLDDLTKGLRTVHRVAIQRSKAVRLVNRALLLQRHSRQLPDKFVPAMRIAAPFGTPDGYRGEGAFECPIQEARVIAAQLFEVIHGSTIDRKAYIISTGADGAPTTKSQQEYIDLNKAEKQILSDRRKQFPDWQTQDNDPNFGPIPGQDARGRTKFMVFCTGDVPATTINRILWEASSIATTWLYGAGALAVLTEPSLSATYYTTADVPSTFGAPPAFAGRDPGAIHDAFLQLTAPLDGRPALWCTQSYVILDAQTARDGTCLLVAETADAEGRTIVERQRAEVLAALPHLAAAELGLASLGQAAGCAGLDGEEGVLTYDRFKSDVEAYDRWKREKTQGKVEKEGSLGDQS